jgi:hypothetical protein
MQPDELSLSQRRLLREIAADEDAAVPREVTPRACCGLMESR